MGSNILIVEDDPILTKVLSEDLQKEGYSVDVAHTGTEGLEKFHSGRPSLVLLDLLLPKMDGFKLIKAMRDVPAGADIPVVMISGVYKNEKSRNEALGSVRADVFLPKPIDFPVLHRTLRKFLGGERPAEVRPPPEAVPELSGELKDVRLPAVFMGLFNGQKNGHMDLSTGTVVRRIYFIHGYPVYVELGPAADNLGRILLYTGQISKEDYEKALRTIAATRKKLGQVLMEEGIFTAPQLNVLLRYQVKEKLVNCFYYRDGSFSFTERDDFINDILIYKIHPGEVIMDGIRKFYTLQEIDEDIGPKMSLPVFISEGASEVVKSLHLHGHKHERDFFALMRSGTPLIEIISKSTLNLTDTFKLVYSLIEMGALSFDKDDEGEEKIDMDESGQGEGVGDPSQAMDAVKKKILEDYFRLKTLDYFEMLCVGEGSTREEIREAFEDHKEFYTPEMIEKLADDEVRSKATELMGKIQHAYETLTDDDLKVAYTREFRKTRSDGKKILKIRSEFSFLEGKDLLGEGRYGPAEEKFREALRFNSDSAEATAYLGWTVYCVTGVKNNAIAMLMKALEMDSCCAEAMYFLGLISKKGGDIDSAVEYFTKALECNPKFKEAEKEFIDLQK